MARQIPLSGEKGSGKFLLCDDADYDLLSQYTWHADVNRSTVYAVTTYKDPETGHRVRRRAHRILRPDAAQVDHRNGDGLDNRRENLRPATRAENQRNRGHQRNSTTRYKGVSLHSSGTRYSAMIGHAGKTRYLSLHATPEAAASAYDDAARELHGEYARTNFTRVSVTASVRWDAL